MKRVCHVELYCFKFTQLLVVIQIRVKDMDKYMKNSPVLRQRPHHVESTSSRPITEVKQRWARLVLGWVTAWEPRVLLASLLFALFHFDFLVFSCFMLS